MVIGSLKIVSHFESAGLNLYKLHTNEVNVGLFNWDIVGSLR